MKLFLENWRKYLIKEEQYSEPDHSKKMRKIYRGMTLDMPSTALASQIRKIVRNKPADLSEPEAAQILLAQAADRGIGISWTLDRRVAVSFASPWGAKNRGKTLHVILTATVAEDFGYDPQAAGEEPKMFYDESEVAFKKGEEIPVTKISVYIDDGDPYKPSLKFRYLWGGEPMGVQA